jgi:hypothetical protein
MAKSGKAKEPSLDDLNEALDVAVQNSDLPSPEEEEELTATDSSDDDGLIDDDLDAPESIDESEVVDDLDDDEETESDEDASDVEDETDGDDEEEVEEVEDAFDDLEGDEVLELDEDALGVQIIDPERGDTLTIKQLLSERVSREEWLERTQRVREEERSSAAREVEGELKLAEERRLIEQEFVSLPVEYSLAAAVQAAKLGLAPPQWPQFVEQAIARLEESGLYNRQQARQQAQTKMQQQEFDLVQRQQNQERAKQWFELQDLKFEREFGTKFFDLPDREQDILRAAFGAAQGSPDLTDLYRQYIGESPSGQMDTERKPTRGGVNGNKAPATSASKRKLMRKISSPKRSDAKGRSASSGKGGKEPSMDELNAALDRNLSLG